MKLKWLQLIWLLWFKLFKYEWKIWRSKRNPSLFCKRNVLIVFHSTKNFNPILHFLELQQILNQPKITLNSKFLCKKQTKIERRKLISSKIFVDIPIHSFLFENNIRECSYFFYSILCRSFFVVEVFFPYEKYSFL